MRINASQLKRYRWEEEEAFRVLSYYFTVRWNWPPFGEYARYVLKDFAVPRDWSEHRNPETPGIPPVYSMLALGPRARNRYRLLYGDHYLYLSDDPGEIVEHLFWHVNSETFRGTGNFLLVHAGSLVAPSGGGLLLPGPSGAGKSTLVAALVKEGFGYLSDEAAAIDPVTGRLYPYAKALSLKRERDGRLGPFGELRPDEDGWPQIKRQWHLRAEDIRPGATGGPCRVRFIVASRYAPDEATGVTPMSAGGAAYELARNSLNISMYRSRALPLLAGVVRGARTFRLVSGDLDESVAAVTALTRRRRSRRGG